jgi:TrmH family RNA methyltransferase
LSDPTSPRLALPVHGLTSFVLVRPHYPENVGASARAMKTMGFSELVLVKPGRLAVPGHEMAFKMAVRAWDVLHGAKLVPAVGDAVQGASLVFATTSRRGVSGVYTARDAARKIVECAARGERTAILFGNEKTGLSEEDRAPASASLRIPMVADQPSINLAQAVQIVAYELLIAGLEARAADAP